MEAYGLVADERLRSRQRPRQSRSTTACAYMATRIGSSVHSATRIGLSVQSAARWSTGAKLARVR